MGNELNVPVKDLKDVIEEINVLEIKGIDKIKTAFVFSATFAIQFLDACDACDAADVSQLSDKAVDVYNKLPSKKIMNEMIAEHDAKKADKKKKKDDKKAENTSDKSDLEHDAEDDAKPSEKKERKKADPKPKSRYGHILSAKSGKLDNALFEGGTMEDIMKDLEVPRTRFIGHSNHLKNDLGLTLVIKEDKDGNALKDHYSIKEESLEKK